MFITSRGTSLPLPVLKGECPDVENMFMVLKARVRLPLEVTALAKLAKILLVTYRLQHY